MNIEYIASIDSTNSELMRRASSGDYSTLCLVTKEQTAGRGRLGRSWLSDADALTFSIGLPLAPLNWSGLSLAVGLSMAQSLHPGVQIKWPNDLWVNGRKLAGILIETAAIAGAPTSQRYTVIGIGINLASPAKAMALAASDDKPLPIGLRELLPESTAQSTLQTILQPLIDTIQIFEQQSFAPYTTGFAARDALQGLSIKLSSGLSGKYQGISSDGELMLQTTLGLQKIISHEVSVCR